MITDQIAPRGLPDHVGVGSDCRKAEAPYHAAVANWRANSAKVADLNRHVANDAETVSAEALRTRVAEIESAKLGLAQDALALNRQYVDFAKGRLPDVKAAHVAADDALGKVE